MARSKPAFMIAFVLLGFPAHAEVEWTDPGVDPYRGTLPDAIAALAAAGAPYEVLDHLAYAFRRGVCKHRPIEEGERIDLMLSGHGVLRDVVARPDRWDDDVPLDVLECQWQGALLLQPEACGNWSYTLRPQSTLPAAPVWIGPPTPIAYALPAAPVILGGLSGSSSGELATVGSSGAGAASPSAGAGQPAAVPEPSTLVLLGGALACLLAACHLRASPGRPSGPK